MNSGEFEIRDGILTKYNGTGREVIIPDGITEIGPYSFQNNYSVNKVVIPGSVRKIGSDAFRECSVLSVVSFPDSLESIGDSAFMGCAELKELRLPPTLAEIGEMCFLGCGFSELTIPERIETIPNMAFSYCPALRKIVLPESLKAITDNAFEGDVNIREVWVASLEQWLGLDIDSEEANPLYPCKRVNYGGGRTDKREEGSLLYIGGELIENLTIPETADHIRDYAFRGCVNLKTLSVPGNLEYIGEYSFCESGLRSVRVSGTVGEIMDKAFFKCAELETIEFSSKPGIVEQSAFKGCKAKPRFQ